MNQLIYLIIVLALGSLFSFIYQIFINKHKIIKVILSIIFLTVFVYVCYNFNYFIYNKYVVITLLISMYIGYTVKMRVKRLIKRK